LFFSQVRVVGGDALRSERDKYPDHAPRKHRTTGAIVAGVIDILKSSAPKIPPRDGTASYNTVRTRAGAGRHEKKSLDILIQMNLYDPPGG
jgi:hypothetical protein